MSVAIVDYGSGNLHSAAKAFERAARDSGHAQPILVTNDPDSGTSKVVKARQFGTPVVDEAAFGQLLRDAAPASPPAAGK